MTQAERIAALETRMAQIEKTVDSMDKKLDDLLALRNKGAGAFWLASALFGTAIVSVATTILNYFRGL